MVAWLICPVAHSLSTAFCFNEMKILLSPLCAQIDLSRVCLVLGQSAANRTCPCASGPPSSPHGFLRCSRWPRAEQGRVSRQNAQHCSIGSPHTHPTLSHFATNTDLGSADDSLACLQLGQHVVYKAESCLGRE